MDRVTIHGRSYPFLSGGTTIRITDTALPFLAFLARNFPAEVNKALGHVGWWLRGEMQEAVYRDAPPSGGMWPSLSMIQRLRTLDDLKGAFKSPATHAFGKLVKALGYRRDKRLMMVQVGWLSKASAFRAAILQKGFSTRVTPRMRRFFAAAGAGIPSGRIESPGRDLINPVFTANRREIGRRIERKVGEYLNNTGRKFGRPA